MTLPLSILYPMELEPIHFIHMAISAGLFLLLWFVVGKGMVKPFLALLEERESRTIGDEQKARETRALSQRISSDIELELHESRVEGVKLREEQVGLAKKEADRLLEGSEKEAATKLEAGRKEIELLSNKARSDLESQVDELSEMLYARVLGKEAPKKQPTVH